MPAPSKIDTTNDYPIRFLEQIHKGPSCEWCKHPEQLVYRAGFCRHCYRIRREVSKLESQIQDRKRKKQFVPQ